MKTINKFHSRISYVNVVLYSLILVFAIFVINIVITASTDTVVKVDVFEGLIVSSDGVELNKHKDDIDISTLKTQNEVINAHATNLIYPLAYSDLLGYNTSSGANGLRGMYWEYLYDAKKGEVGKTLELTVNHNLQMHCYNILKSYSGHGSIVVMNTKTGEMEAMVSTKPKYEYNANLKGSMYSSWVSVNGYLTPEWLTPVCPGSTFKIVSGLGILSAKEEDYKYNDETGSILVAGKEIGNANGAIFGEMDLKKALEKSSNVYFVDVYAKSKVVGIDYLEDAADAFMLGQNITTDFGIIKSTWSVDKNDVHNIAQTVFGQGKTQYTTVQGAMIIASIVNGGKMLRPYVVASDTAEESMFEKLIPFSDLSKNKTEVLGKTMSRSDAKDLKKYLSNNAEYYGIGKKFYAKSGTAQLDDEDKEHQSWILVANDDHAVAISIRNAGFGMYLADNAKSILDMADSLFD